MEIFCCLYSTTMRKSFKYGQNLGIFSVFHLIYAFIPSSLSKFVHKLEDLRQTFPLSFVYASGREISKRFSTFTFPVRPRRNPPQFGSFSDRRRSQRNVQVSFLTVSFVQSWHRYSFPNITHFSIKVM